MADRARRGTTRRRAAGRARGAGPVLRPAQPRAPGPPLASNYLVTAGQAGLPSFSAAGVRLVNLIPITQPQGFTTATAPNIAGATEYVDRANQLDLRFSKIFRLSKYRTSINFDLNNALNTSAVLAVNNAYGPTWQAPLNIMDARLMKFSAQFEF